MNRYSKTLLSMLFASATAFFICVITTGQVFAVQDEAIEIEMTEEEYAAYEIEYNAWEAADKETDALRSGTMLIEFLQKNSNSLLVPHAESSYMQLLARCLEEKKFQELLTLAEQWNAFRPGNENIIRMVAVAAEELKNTEKLLWALEDMYKRTPQIDFAKRITGLYKEMGNDAKYFEWADILLTAPEEATNFLLQYQLRYELFLDQFPKDGDLSKMPGEDLGKLIEHAQSVLKTIEQLQNPPAEVARDLPEVRRILNHTIGSIHQRDKNYNEAITYFMRALQDKRYSDGYFQIGSILWEQQRILNARLAFAKAQIFGESADASPADKTIAPIARERMEQLHRALHNNTLVNIQRQYDRAREMSDEDLLGPMN